MTTNPLHSGRRFRRQKKNSSAETPEINFAMPSNSIIIKDIARLIADAGHQEILNISFDAFAARQQVRDIKLSIDDKRIAIMFGEIGDPAGDESCSDEDYSKNPYQHSYVLSSLKQSSADNIKKFQELRLMPEGICVCIENLDEGSGKAQSFIDHKTIHSSNLIKDVYIATVYISPENSSVNVSGIEPIYNQLLADTVKYSSLGHTMLQADFNAYRNTKPDYVTFDESKKTNLEDSHYVDDKIMSRNNLDPKLIDNSGKILLSLCKESGRRILNGRTIGDLHRKNTCITYNECSVVDYMLVSNDLLNLR
ncbi:unnamed protein product [Mytilus coruscus]|uniref:Endonuclease/exonuclease/phosphatase domain-containing protein n=1 Tax=Mytilus coruscus TaxID=42192 RepID=A0A6J8CXE7_MYTCO|nr:unnamed protein product [Mytilus coruscus]